jgi:hypothetical protein
MPAVTLKALLSARSGNLPVLTAMFAAMGGNVSISDTSDRVLLGDLSSTKAVRVPIAFEDTTLGYVSGPDGAAHAIALLLARMTAKESESKALGSEVLHLYREMHLIEQLSEQLSALLDYSAVSQSALEQAQRLIPATAGCILVMETAYAPLVEAASFGDVCALTPDSRFAASVLERGVAEIVNDCGADPRALVSECNLAALMCAPLRSGQRTVGVIALASTEAGASYSAANLKLLNTIALQTAAAIANALLCAEMVETAQARAAFAAELHAASTVQNLLLQSASRPTPGFRVESVYVPASEVGGDFFFVSSAPDGSLTAIVGDVSGKGLTAAMRVAMILGVLRRETSHDPSAILAALNNALIVEGQLGFTTACCIRLSLNGDFLLANAGHIAPYLSGREVETAPALPLGLVPDQHYELVSGKLEAGDRLVVLSDGVPEARALDGELYGFDRLTDLTLLPAVEIAAAAQGFGQEDDITVLTLALGV